MSIAAKLEDLQEDLRRLGAALTERAGFQSHTRQLLIDLDNETSHAEVNRAELLKLSEEIENDNNRLTRVYGDRLAIPGTKSFVPNDPEGKGWAVLQLPFLG